MSTFSTSSRQKGSKPSVFYTFDFEMCFVPQRRALFRHFFQIGTSKSGPRPSVFYTFDLEMCFAPQRRALFWHRNFQKSSDTEVFSTFSLRNVLRATTACTFSTSQPPKVVRTPGVLYILTSKCASRHNGVHFFDISTSKSGPTLRCFVHFDLEMCFAPQRRALFRHPNFQKWSGPGVFCTFWLGNVLRATTACNFSSLIWPAGSAPAALASLLFDSPEPQITLEKHSVSRLSYLFAHLHLLSSDSFSSDLLSSNLSLLSASSLLCFSSVHIVGSLTSKLPSNHIGFGLSQYFCWKPSIETPELPSPVGNRRPWHRELFFAALKVVHGLGEFLKQVEKPGWNMDWLGKSKETMDFPIFWSWVPLIFPLKPLKGQGISPHLQRSPVTNPQAEEPGGIRSRIHPVEPGLSKVSVHRQPVLMGTQKVPQLFS